MLAVSLDTQLRCVKMDGNAKKGIVRVNILNLANDFSKSHDTLACSEDIKKTKQKKRKMTHLSALDANVNRKKVGVL